MSIFAIVWIIVWSVVAYFFGYGNGRDSRDGEAEGYRTEVARLQRLLTEARTKVRNMKERCARGCI